MARQAMFDYDAGMFIFPLRPTLNRINRKLASLTPFKYMKYDHARTDYYIYTVNIGQPDHMQELGPYHFKWMIGLADMLNIWTIEERGYQPKILLADGRRHEQAPLPVWLQFPVLTPILQAAYGHLDPQTAAGVQKIAEAATQVYKSFSGARTLHARDAAMAAVLRSKGWTVKPPLPDTPESATVPTDPHPGIGPEPGPEEVFDTLEDAAAR